ncbi:MAG TPA: hypothetical protein VN408_06020 [Actinoplanes sp.]|nr:hypothetical protein [Actinoplanes sp.]
MSRPPEFCTAVDVEADGPIPGPDDMFSLGMAVTPPGPALAVPPRPARDSGAVTEAVGSSAAGTSGVIAGVGESSGCASPDRGTRS